MTQSSLLSHSVLNQAKPNVTECQPKRCFSLAKHILKSVIKNIRMIQLMSPFFCPAMCPWTCFQYWFWVRTFSGLFELKHNCKTFKRHLKLHGAFHSHICLFSNTGEELKNHFHQAISRLQKITATVPRATYQSPAKICQQTAHNESLIGESERPK